MTENMHWKLPMNLKTLENMGRHDLVKRELDRQKALKEADKVWLKEHGRYITESEFADLRAGK